MTHLVARRHAAFEAPRQLCSRRPGAPAILRACQQRRSSATEYGEPDPLHAEECGSGSEGERRLDHPPHFDRFGVAHRLKAAATAVADHALGLLQRPDDLDDLVVAVLVAAAEGHSEHRTGHAGRVAGRTANMAARNPAVAGGADTFSRKLS